MSKPISSEHMEIRDLISRTFAELGGRATKADITAHVGLMLPTHLTEYLIGEGLGSQVGAFFRSKTDGGLPVAPHIGDGIHMDLELFSVDDFRWCIKHQMKSSKASRKQAVAYRDECLAQHGVLVDLDDPMAGAA